MLQCQNLSGRFIRKEITTYRIGPLVRRSKSNHSIWKNIFCFGCRWIERQEAKLENCLFFYVRIFLNNSVISILSENPLFLLLRGPSLYYVSKRTGWVESEKWQSLLTTSIIYSDIGWVRKSPKLCWRNIWMVPPVFTIHV